MSSFDRIQKVLGVQQLTLESLDKKMLQLHRRRCEREIESQDVKSYFQSKILEARKNLEANRIEIDKNH